MDTINVTQLNEDQNKQKEVSLLKMLFQALVVMVPAVVLYSLTARHLIDNVWT